MLLLSILSYNAGSHSHVCFTEKLIWRLLDDQGRIGTKLTGFKEADASFSVLVRFMEMLMRP